MDVCVRELEMASKNIGAKESRENAGFDRYPLAARRVGGVDPEARLAWLLNFAQLPREEFSEPTLIEIQEDMIAFAWLQNAWLRERFRAAVTFLTRDTALEIQEAVNVALNSLAMGEEWAVVGKVELRLKRKPDGTISEMLRAQDLKQEWLWAMSRLLRDQGARLGKCARSECPRFFVRHKGGLYCSKKCSQKVRDDRRNTPKSKR
jgi:hypothetical protein